MAGDSGGPEERTVGYKLRQGNFDLLQVCSSIDDGRSVPSENYLQCFPGFDSLQAT